MKRPKKLSASFVKTVNRPGRYGDGRGGFGLSLLVKPTTTGRLSKTWSQRLRVHGRPVNVGLGAYPVVTLAEVRKAALENRRTAARGQDPRSGGVPTFAEAVEAVIAIHSPTWRSRGKVRSQLAEHAAELRAAADRPQARQRDHDGRRDGRAARRRLLEPEARDGTASAPADRSGDEVGRRARVPRGQPRPVTPSARLFPRTAAASGTSGRCRTLRLRRRLTGFTRPGRARPPNSPWRCWFSRPVEAVRCEERSGRSST